MPLTMTPFNSASLSPLLRKWTSMLVMSGMTRMKLIWIGSSSSVVSMEPPAPLRPRDWLKRNGFRPDQVQAFLPTPLAIATAMYHTGRNPLRRIRRGSEQVSVPQGIRQRRLHKAFLRYHDPENWPLLREALKKMGRSDLIGNGKRHLVPSWQPGGRPLEKKQVARRARPSGPQRRGVKRSSSGRGKR